MYYSMLFLHTSVTGLQHVTGLGEEEIAALLSWRLDCI